jgi:hypothetical protein
MSGNNLGHGQMPRLSCNEPLYALSHSEQVYACNPSCTNWLAAKLNRALPGLLPLDGEMSKQIMYNPVNCMGTHNLPKLYEWI